MRSVSIVFLFFCISSVALAQPVTLSGSPSAMDQQYSVSVDLGLTPATDSWKIVDLVNDEVLVDVIGNENYELYDVSFPFALPFVKSFIEHLASHYRNVFCGRRLVITSLTRPIDLQPRNSHPKSVHPTGMAMDLRVHPGSNCEGFLRRILLSFEKYGKVQATREYRPPHFHVVVYPDDF